MKNIDIEKIDLWINKIIEWEISDEIVNKLEEFVNNAYYIDLV